MLCVQSHAEREAHANTNSHRGKWRLSTAQYDQKVPYILREKGDVLVSEQT